MPSLLNIQNLSIEFKTDSGTLRAVDSLSFNINEGDRLGIVGESGSGKSATCLSVLRLLPTPTAKIVSGSIFYKRWDLLQLSQALIQKVRGKHIGMIFQDPMSSLNPLFTLRMQMNETLKAHHKLSTRQADEKSIDMLKKLGIQDAETRIRDYPHQFSGGMRQRVLIGMALLPNPKLLIADEPTTALDMTVQKQIVTLLQDTLASKPEMGMILVTHNLSLVGALCKTTLVLYAGRMLEYGPTQDILKDPLHPYTHGLKDAIPSALFRKKLYSIPGQIPSLQDLPSGCKFHPRCPRAMPQCQKEEPPLFQKTSERKVRCWLYHD